MDDTAVAGLSNEDEVYSAYLLHGPELYRFVLRGLGDRGAAQDVVQETFIKAWRSAERYDPTLASLRVWLFGIARNAMIDHARAAKVRPWQGNLVDPPTVQDLAGSDQGDPVEKMMTSWVVEEALRHLAEHHRVAIVRTHLQERPYEEVAAELGIPVGTLRSRVFYGLKALRVAIDEMGVTP
ncbi:sigma-70 family RNA polymerase sigma factor [Nocardioides sp.]|uniref:sigma-70 family RNA polymerase sigma factor n=1 Tax=Nocardioides sp. TaxID=35761 RepID=UPI000C93F255|nr:RNA polymerase subunit sigma-70 [Pimelobacter sp.]